MNDWTMIEENTNDEGEAFKRLAYKNNEGLKSYIAYYYTAEKIYVEVWACDDGVKTFMEGGMTWSEALEYEL